MSLTDVGVTATGLLTDEVGTLFIVKHPFDLLSGFILPPFGSFSLNPVFDSTVGVIVSVTLCPFLSCPFFSPSLVVFGRGWWMEWWVGTFYVRF